MRVSERGGGERRLGTLAVLLVLIAAGCQDMGTAPQPETERLHLVFSSQPAHTVAGKQFPQAVTVQIVDATGKLVTDDTRTVSLVLSSNPAGGLLSGTATVAAQGGIATFDTLAIDRFGYGYILAATSDPALPAATSGEIGVVPQGDVSFQLRVKPILSGAGCIGCHGGTNNLFLDSVPAILRGGAHGPAAIPGNSAQSLVITKTSSTPPFGSRMPYGGPPLPDTSRWVMRAWIDQGARDN